MRNPRSRNLLPGILAASLAAGWALREVSHARAERTADAVTSRTVNLDQVAMGPYRESESHPVVGKVGTYLAGDTPASTKFVTGRFVLDAGQTPHPPHTHVEEEVMIVESGKGEIDCGGKVTQVGPGSVMYTTPDVPHAIVNTGKIPLVFYFIKWASKNAR